VPAAWGWPAAPQPDSAPPGRTELGSQSTRVPPREISGPNQKLEDDRPWRARGERTSVMESVPEEAWVAEVAEEGEGLS
jgi:hypothetical protein